MKIDFTDRELRMMNIHWEEGSATVHQTLERLDDEDLRYSRRRATSATSGRDGPTGTFWRLAEIDYLAPDEVERLRHILEEDASEAN